MELIPNLYSAPIVPPPPLDDDDDEEEDGTG